MPNPVVARVDKCGPSTGLAWIGDRQAWLSREGRKWSLCDDYTGETILVTGTTVDRVVRAWGVRIGVEIGTIDTEIEY
jgi:hypothetical protein